MITIEAVPEPGWIFSHWYGDVEEDQEESKVIELKMDEDKVVTVQFEEIEDIILPSIQIVNPSDGSFIDTSSVDVVWSSNEGTHSINYHEIRLNKGSWVDIGVEEEYTFEGLEEGEYTVTVRVHDSQGNYDEDSILFNIYFEEEFLPDNLVLDVNPTEGNVPLEVTIFVSAENNGDKDGSIDVLVDGIVEYELFIPQEGYAEHTFTHTFVDVGVHLVRFSDLTETIEVLLEHSFIPTNLVLDVERLQGNAPLTTNITVSADNVGQLEGSIDLIIDDVVQHTLDIPPGESVEDVLTLEFEKPGKYSIEFHYLAQEVDVQRFEEEIGPDEDDSGFPIWILLVIGSVAVISVIIVAFSMNKKPPVANEQNRYNLNDNDQQFINEDQTMMDNGGSDTVNIPQEDQRNKW